MAKIVHLDGYFDNPDGSFLEENAVLSAVGESVHAPQQGGWEDAVNAEVILVRAEKITAKDIGAFKKCRAIIRYGIGLDKIDLEAATQAGIAVCNVPDFCVQEMADHTVALALTLHRRLPEYQEAARKGEWLLQRNMPISDSSAQWFVTLGFGRIARQVLHRAKAFGFQVAAADPFVSEQTIQNEGVVPLSLDQALCQADLLSLHCPLTPDTRNLLNADTLATMKTGAVLINTARGALVDTEALTVALEQGKLRAAGLDVTEPEPLPVGHPLYHMQQVIITPHMAWYSEQAESRLKKLVAEEALRALKNEPLRHPVRSKS